MKPLLACLLLISTTIFSQEIAENKDLSASKKIEVVPDNFNKDSLQLVNHKEATLIDSLWLNSMYNSPLFDSDLYVISEEKIIDETSVELSTEVLKERLTHLNSKTPFNVAYNPSLERIIKSYLKHRSNSLANLMEKAQYYFPMFEEHLDKFDLPLEIKYLAIVESALKPRARSRVGASGVMAIYVLYR